MTAIEDKTATTNGIATEDTDRRLEDMFASNGGPLVRIDTPFNERYTTVERLGDGSQGHVFRVEDKETGETYILKKIIVPMDADEVIQQNVQREVQSLRRMDHTAIPKLLGYKVEDDDENLWKEHFLLMKDNGGQSLDKRWKDYGPFSQQDCQHLHDKCMDTLAYAHSQGVMHRDIKPENILTDEDGNVTIIDWGVARFETQQTRLGTVGAVGTPGYMAPEQMGGEGKTSFVTDLYGLAATIVAARRGESVSVNEGSEELQRIVCNLFDGDLEEELWSMLQEHPDDRAEDWGIEDGEYFYYEDDEVCDEAVVQEDNLFKSISWMQNTFLIGLGCFGIQTIDCLASDSSLLRKAITIGGYAVMYGVSMGVGYGLDRLSGKYKTTKQLPPADPEVPEWRQKLEHAAKGSFWTQHMTWQETIGYLDNLNGDFQSYDYDTYLTIALKHKHWRVRQAAVLITAKHGCMIASDYIAQMIQDDENEAVRNISLHALLQLRPSAESIEKYVAPHLENELPRQRARALIVLSKLDNEGKYEEKAKEMAANDPVLEVKRVAALYQKGPDHRLIGVYNTCWDWDLPCLPVKGEE